MIVKMKKVSVFIKDTETDAALTALREAGLLHIMTPKKDSRETEMLSEQVSRYEQVISILENYSPGTHRGEKLPVYQSHEELVGRVIALDDEISDFHERMRELGRMERFFEEWGDFDPHDIEALSDEGHFIYLAKIQEEDLPEDIPYITLLKEKKQRRVMFVTTSPNTELPVEPASPPPLSLKEIRKERASIEQKIEIIHDHYRSVSGSVKSLRETLAEFIDALDFREVKNGLEEAHPVKWMTGFVPHEDIDQITAAARKYSWGLLIDDPTQEEPVPTKLMNKSFVRLIEPIFEVLGTVPGYREYDISGLFLVFFSIFVAMIIGDAGYGMFFLAGTVFLHRKSGKINQLTGLLYLLSIMTIIWGSVTGTWFGSEAIASAPPFRNLMIPGLASFPSIVGLETMVTQNNVIYLCFIIGTIHLSIACLMNIKRDFPRLAAVSHLGWLFLIIGLYYLVLNLVLGMDMPAWPIYFIAGGFSLIVIFGAQQEGQSFMKGLVRGLGGMFTTFLDSISTFSNIISYIRLFAVGMATVAISSSFNSMAAPMFGGVLIPAALLVLLIGHGLNIVMALLSVFVHGIRLNMLEFSGQLGMEWTGFKYEPFGDKKTSHET